MNKTLTSIVLTSFLMVTAQLNCAAASPAKKFPSLEQLILRSLVQELKAAKDIERALELESTLSESVLIKLKSTFTDGPSRIIAQAPEGTKQVVWSRDGFCAAASDTQLALYSPQGMQIGDVIDISPVRAICWAGNYLILSTRDSTSIYCIDLDDPNCLINRVADQVVGHSPRVSGSGEYFTLQDNDLTFIYRVSDGASVGNSIEGIYNNNIFWAPHGNTCVVCMNDRSVTFIRIDQDEQLQTTDLDGRFELESTCWHPTGEFIAIGERARGQRGCQTRLYDVYGTPVTELGNIVPRTIRFSPTGNYFTAGFEHVCLYALDAAGAVVQCGEQMPGKGFDVVWSRHGMHFALKHNDKSFCIYSVDEMQAPQPSERIFFKGSSRWVRWSRDDSHIFTSEHGHRWTCLSMHGPSGREKETYSSSVWTEIDLSIYTSLCTKFAQPSWSPLYSNMFYAQNALRILTPTLTVAQLLLSEMVTEDPNLFERIKYGDPAVDHKLIELWQSFLQERIGFTALEDDGEGGDDAS